MPSFDRLDVPLPERGESDGLGEVAQSFPRREVVVVAVVLAGLLVLLLRSEQLPATLGQGSEVVVVISVALGVAAGAVLVPAAGPAAAVAHLSMAGHCDDVTDQMSKGPASAAIEYVAAINLQ